MTDTFQEEGEERRRRKRGRRRRRKRRDFKLNAFKGRDSKKTGVETDFEFSLESITKARSLKARIFLDLLLSSSVLQLSRCLCY